MRVSMLKQVLRSGILVIGTVRATVRLNSAVLPCSTLQKTETHQDPGKSSASETAGNQNGHNKANSTERWGYAEASVTVWHSGHRHC